MASWLSDSLAEVVLILINYQCISCFYFWQIKFVVVVVFYADRRNVKYCVQYMKETNDLKKFLPLFSSIG